MTTLSEMITQQAQHLDTIKSQELKDCTAMSYNDMMAQGDIALVLVEPKPFCPLRGVPQDTFQLAEGNTRGSRHCIREDDRQHVAVSQPTEHCRVLFRNATHVIVASAPWVLTHPEHAHLLLPAGMFVVIAQSELGLRVLD